MGDKTTSLRPISRVGSARAPSYILSSAKNGCNLLMSRLCTMYVQYYILQHAKIRCNLQLVGVHFYNNLVYPPASFQRRGSSLARSFLGYRYRTSIWVVRTPTPISSTCHPRHQRFQPHTMRYRTSLYQRCLSVMPIKVREACRVSRHK